MQLPKFSFKLLVLTALLLLIGLISSATGWAQSPEPRIYLPLVANGSGQQSPGPTPTPEWQYGYVAENQVWQSLPEIPVCWVNPSAADNNERLWVQQRIHNTWESHSNIRFVGWGQCLPENAENAIRIKIADEGPHVKTLGQAIRKFDEGMVLNFTFLNWSTNPCALSESNRKACIETGAVHEFGHALAFAHEQNRPDTPAWCSGQEQGQNGNIIVGQWDVNSIMNYCNLRGIGNSDLSNGDIVTLQTFYGTPPPPPPPVIRNWNISGKMVMWDDENFGSDERGTHVFADSRVLTTAQNAQTYVITRCTGGEVRGEIQLQLQLEAGGAVRVTGTLLYYEGTSCSTNDLERTQELNYLLLPGETQSVAIALGDGDGSVTFEFSMSNSQ